MPSVRISARQWRIAALVVGAIALGAILGLTRREETVEVLAAPATIQDMKNLVTTNGTVIPTSEFQARANFPGIVEKVDVELGDKVKPGQMLVTMKDPFAAARIASANSQLESTRLAEENIQRGGSQEEKIGMQGDLAQAQLAQTQAAKALAALQQLQQKGAASAAEVQAAQQKLDVANATLKTEQEKNSQPFSPQDATSVKARMSDARANLKSAQIQFDNANISSPMAGTVYAIQVAAWDFVPMGADLIRVANLSSVEVRAYFDEPEIGKLIAGQPVTIAWEGKPGREWHGHIKQAPVAAVALGPRSVGECVITVDDSKEDLLPNTNVMVTATIQQHLHVLTVPRAALYSDGDAHYVYRVAAGRLQRTPVQAGIVNLDRAEIVSGLALNDTVALSALDNRVLSDGLTVRTVQAITARPGLLNYILRLLR